MMVDANECYEIINTKICLVTIVLFVSFFLFVYMIEKLYYNKGMSCLEMLIYTFYGIIYFLVFIFGSGDDFFMDDF